MHGHDTGNPFIDYPLIFWELLRSPWGNLDVAWGVIPMYMSLVMCELYEPKPSPKNAVQGGANLLWAGIDWGRVSLMPLLTNSHGAQRGVLDMWYSYPPGQRWGHLSDCLAPLGHSPNPLIATTTFATILLGIASIVHGVGKKKKGKLSKYFRYGRFSCYFCILLYPLQTQVIAWSEHGWTAVFAIALFALPVWLLFSLVFQGILRLK